MQIDSIRIVDFRGIKDKEFYFDPHFNVLIGENGSGKTSVLEALAVALSPYVAVGQRKNIRPVRIEDVRTEDFSLHNEKKINARLTVNATIDGKAVEWGIKNPYFKEDGNSKIKKKDTSFKNDAEIKKIARMHQAILAEDGGKNLVLPVFDYLGSGRLWQDTHRYIDTLPKGSRYAGYEDCLKSISSIRRFTEWFKTMEFSKLQGNETAKWRMEVVQRSISNCLEGWDNILFSAEDDILMAEKENGKNGKQTLPVSYLSDGQRNIIGMVADIAYRCVLLNPYLESDAAKKSPGIVLIDELDLHLHPKWQRTIVQKLKDTFPKIQFITTTHSPFIVQSLKSEELTNLEEKYSESDYLNKGIEWVSENIMGVEHAESSDSYFLNKELAKEYLTITEKMKNTKDATEVQKLENELNSLENEMKLLIERNAVNPAFAAFLELKRKKAINI